MSVVGKRRLVPNIFTNYFLIFSSTLVGIWMTPYLIRRLGVGAYGLIPLMATIVGYFSFLTNSVSSSVGRFVSISINSGEKRTANLYFNTAFYSLLVIIFLIFAIGLSIVGCIGLLIDIPDNLINEARILFLCTIVSFGLNTITSTFYVSTFVSHRFDLSNYAKIIAKLIQPTIMVLLFSYIGASLAYVGVSYLSASVCIFIIMFFVSKRLCPYLRVGKGYFDVAKFCEMAQMSFWALVNSLGALLYVSIDLLVINIFLGANLVGYYAPFVQIVLLVTLLIDAISGVFSPIAYEYISNKRVTELVRQTKRTLMLIGLFIALPIGIICGFSEPLLAIWLGGEFPKFHVLMWLLLLPGLLYHPVRPMFAINRGLNMVKYPAIVTFAGGVANVVLSILFVKYTSLGIYGVGLSTAICYLIKNYIFSPLYCSKILNISYLSFYKDLSYGLLGGGFVFLLSKFIARNFVADNIYDLFIGFTIIGLVYSVFVLGILYFVGELGFFLKLLFEYKTGKFKIGCID